MDVKFGKIRANNNIFLSSQANAAQENFFESAPEIKWPSFSFVKQKPAIRMNDFDSNILENNAYQTLPDEMLKMEHKMGLLEQNLKKIETEIETLESLGYDIKLYGLKERKYKIEQELAELNEKYSNLSLSAKISGQIASVINHKKLKKLNLFSKAKKFLSKKILAKLFKKIDYSQNMKEALDNLSGINSSIDELINMQSPYGENINRYEKLTAYLNKANSLHSQINKNVSEATKKKA